MSTELFNTPAAVKAAALSDRIAAAVNSAAFTAGRPFEGLASRWKAEADRRSEARNPDAQAALREANRERLEALRDLRRDRRAFEKARDEVKWWNVTNGERRAARMVVRDSREAVADATAARNAAKAAFPLPLTAVAVRCHALYLTATATWVTVDGSFLSVASFSLGALAVAINGIGIPLGLRRLPDTATDQDLEALQPSQEERDLLQRLQPKAFARVAEPRGLGDVLVASATLTPSGVQAKLTLQLTMNLAKLKTAEPALRAALRMKSTTRLELREGKTGGHVRLTIRTRSAASNVSLSGWTPGASWGIDTVTGEEIPVPLGRRMLVAGTSGSGKSWSTRCVLAEASEWDDHRLVVIDRKQVEARNWEHRARTAVSPDEILDVTDELVDEMHRRLALIPRGEDVVQISPERPRITVFVDEGGEAIAASKLKSPKAGPDEEAGPDYARIIENLRTIARMGRAAEIILIWATQKPTLSGDGHGIDSQIAAQITYRASLALATSTEAQVVFGPDAIEKGWKAHELPMPGVAMLRSSPTAEANPIRTRAFSPKDVVALPDRPVWSRRSSFTGATAEDVRARKQSESAGDPWSSVTVALSDPAPTVAFREDERVFEALRAEPCVTTQALAVELGVSEASAKRSLDMLEAEGVVERDEDGCWRPL